MSLRFAGIALGLGLLVGRVGQSAEPPGAAQPATVLELAFVDDAGTPRQRESTGVRILSDGSVLAPAAAGNGLVVADRLSREDLSALVDEVVVRSRLDRVDSNQLGRGVEAACRAAGLSPSIEGAATVRIRFQSAAGPRDVQCPALSVMAARFPDFTELQQLLHAQLRLQNVAAVAQAGGARESQRLAEVANRSLKASHPDVPPVTKTELSMVRQVAAGSRYVQFYRRGGTANDELLISLFEMPGEPPRVDVIATPAKLE